MKTIEKIVRDYLEKSELLEHIKLGPETVQRKPSKEAIALVEAALKNYMNTCNRVILVAVILLFVLVMLFVCIGIFTAFSGKTIVLLGGSFLSLTVIVIKLINATLEKSTIAVTLAIINNQPPEFKEKAIEALYWNLLKKNKESCKKE